MRARHETRAAALLVAGLLSASCAHPSGPQGYWVRNVGGEPDGAATEWLWLRDDQLFELHMPTQIIEGHYAQDGNVIILRADFEARCTLEGKMLRCGKDDAFKRAPARP